MGSQAAEGGSAADGAGPTDEAAPEGHWSQVLGRERARALFDQTTASIPGASGQWSAGTVTGPGGEFVASLSSLAAAVANLPQRLWPAIIQREIARWGAAVQHVDQTNQPIPPDSLRIRLTAPETAISSLTRPASSINGKVVWEVVLDHGTAITGLNTCADPDCWQRAVQCSISRAATSSSSITLDPYDGAGRLTIVASPYLTSLLLVPQQLVATLGPGHRGPVRVRVIANSLLLLAGSDRETEAESAVVESLDRFARQSDQTFPPFTVSLSMSEKREVRSPDRP